MKAAQTELLDGFRPWPSLLFTPDVLEDIGLPSPPPGSRRTFQVYNKLHGSWFNVKEGYPPAPHYSSGRKIPTILCGDFNSTPGSGVYQFLSEGKVPQEVLDKLPPADLYAKAVFPTLEEQNNNKTIVTTQWDSVVGANVQ